MKKIISLSAIREKRARVTPMRTEDYKLGIQTHKPLGKSPSHRKSHLRQSVNPYETIQILKRIIELQRQGICLLTQELEGVKRQ
ncbi:hypothetical protein ES703_81932 [subsurface metagenome]